MTSAEPALSSSCPGLEKVQASSTSRQVFALGLWVDVCASTEYKASLRDAVSLTNYRMFFIREARKTLRRYGLQSPFFKEQGDGFIYMEENASHFNELFLLRDIIEVEFHEYIHLNVYSESREKPRLRAVLFGGVCTREIVDDGEREILIGECDDRASFIIDKFSEAKTIVDSVCRWLIPELFDYSDLHDLEFVEGFELSMPLYSLDGLSEISERSLNAGQQTDLFGPVIREFHNRTFSKMVEPRPSDDIISEFRELAGGWLNNPDVNQRYEIATQLKDVFAKLAPDERIPMVRIIATDVLRPISNMFGVLSVFKILDDYPSCLCFLDELDISESNLTTEEISFLVRSSSVDDFMKWNEALSSRELSE